MVLLARRSILVLPCLLVIDTPQTVCPQAAGLVDVVDLHVMDRLSMACPALPLCGLAITEAERGLPDINKRVRSLLHQVGLGDEPITMRMTGCPNGCARPYMAEIGFVGDGPNTYQVRGHCDKLWLYYS